MTETAVAYVTRDPGELLAPGLRGPVRGPVRWSRCLPSQPHSQLPDRQRLLVRERAGAGPESLLHAAWRRLGAGSAAIRGRDGHAYRVIYPGRPADGSGPDFRDAELLRDDGTRVRGHVEIHVRAGDWHSHGHGFDAAYNGVVIHVVGSDSGRQVVTQAGVRIPLLVLSRTHIDAPAAGEVLDDAGHVTAVPLPTLDMSAAGDEWFRNRVHAYRLQFRSMGVERSFWAGALECLGYPSNKKGFRQLAERIDWRTASDFAGQRSPADVDRLFEWAAGFGPKPTVAPQIRANVPEWSPRHGRPANSPRTRVIAAARWAVNWSGDVPLLERFTAAVLEATSAADLARIFSVDSVPGKPSPLGRSRASDIVVNHLLPAVCAAAEDAGDRDMARRATHFFQHHPLLSPNAITREASRLLAARGVEAKPRSARQQQGLIHIYRIAVSSQRGQQQLPLL